MSAQSEALQLADALELSSNHRIRREAAAELRRLAEVEDNWMALSQDQGKSEGQIDRLVAQRDALQAAIDACAIYLKEGETPAQRIERDHRDSLALMRLLAQEKHKSEALLEALKRIADWDAAGLALTGDHAAQARAAIAKAEGA